MKAALAMLPVAGTGPLGELGTSPAHKQIREAVENARVVDEVHGTDGSSIVTIAVGTEEIRSALLGPARPGDAGLSAVIVDARKLALRPALALAVRVGGARHLGPALFFESVGEARKDPRVGQRAPASIAMSISGRELLVSGLSPEQLVDAQRSSAVIAYVVKREKVK